jgi:hypothetical protein
VEKPEEICEHINELTMKRDPFVVYHSYISRKVSGVWGSMQGIVMRVFSITWVRRRPEQGS